MKLKPKLFFNKFGAETYTYNNKPNYWKWTDGTWYQPYSSPLTPYSPQQGDWSWWCDGEPNNAGGMILLLFLIENFHLLEGYFLKTKFIL